MVREIRKDELDQLKELYFDYTAKENLPPISQEKTAEIWAQIETNLLVHYFVLEEADRIVAACILSITPSFIRGGSGYGVIEHVVTSSLFRRKGYGEKIVRHALTYAWDNGCTEVMLLSGAQNEKIGFDQHRRKGFIIFKPQ